MIYQQIITRLTDYALSHPEQAATLIAALVGIGFNYQKTGTIPLGRLPWRHLRQSFRELGDSYFGVSRPRGVPGLMVDAMPFQIEQSLRQRHYESSDLFSYEYKGEVWNLRRPSGQRRHPKTGMLTPMETHPRGFDIDGDRTLIICHDEASRMEAQGPHLDESMMSWERGRDLLMVDLDGLGIEYEQIESEADAGITVDDAGAVEPTADDG
jgi:hypothetical protein